MSIIGHDKEKDIFRNILQSGKLHHAYIFSGREGSGKKLFASQLAKAILCEDQKFLEPCQCRHCRVAEGSAHPDIHIYEESPIKVDAARNISNNAFMSPLSAKRRLIS